MSVTVEPVEVSEVTQPEVADDEQEERLHSSLLSRFRRQRVTIEMVIDTDRFEDPCLWPWPQILGFNGTLRDDRAKIVQVKSEDLGNMLMRR